MNFKNIFLIGIQVFIILIFMYQSTILFLEFHGRQHYEFVEYFHKTKDNFKSRIIKDKIKKEAALSKGKNYVSISHHIDDLEKVLSFFI